MDFFHIPFNLNEDQKNILMSSSAYLRDQLQTINTDYTVSDKIVSAKMPDQKFFDNCKIVTSRQNLIDKLPKNSIIAELGTQKGIFANDILNICKPKELHLFDIMTEDYNNSDFNELKAFAKFHSGNSDEMLDRLPDNYFDWIYIDADHSYMGVKKDIYVAIKKIKPGGYLVFNDFTTWSIAEFLPYGVYHAVLEAISKYSCTVEYIALQELGYHDIAIRKPFVL